MNSTMILVIVTGMVSLCFGIVGKIIWDWFIIKNKAKEDVTTVLLSVMSDDIKGLQIVVEKIPAEFKETMEKVFERLRDLDICTTVHHEKICNLEKQIFHI